MLIRDIKTKLYPFLFALFFTGLMGCILGYFGLLSFVWTAISAAGVLLSCIGIVVVVIKEAQSHDEIQAD